MVICRNISETHNYPNIYLMDPYFPHKCVGRVSLLHRDDLNTTATPARPIELNLSSVHLDLRPGSSCVCSCCICVCQRLVKVRLSKPCSAEKTEVGSEHLGRGATIHISASKWICPDKISRQKA